MNVIKLNDLSRWRKLPADSAIHFRAVPSGARLVRLQLNAANAGTLAIVRDGAGPEFLAAVEPGLNMLEFHAAGAFKVMADEECGSVRYQTSEAETCHVCVSDPEIFTGIAVRRERNPEIERLMYVMRQTIDHRLAQQAASFNQQLAEAKGRSDGKNESREVSSGSRKAAKPAVADPADDDPEIEDSVLGIPPAKPAKPRLDASGEKKSPPAGSSGARDPQGEVAEE